MSNEEVLKRGKRILNGIINDDRTTTTDKMNILANTSISLLSILLSGTETIDARQKVLDDICSRVLKISDTVAKKIQEKQ